MQTSLNACSRVWMCVRSIMTTIPVRVQKVSALSHDLKANNVQSKINDVLCVQNVLGWF